MRKLTSYAGFALFAYALINAVAGIALMIHDAFDAFLDWYRNN